MPNETENKYEELDAFIESLGLTYTAAFVPQSASRNSQEKRKTLNWRVTISRNNRALASDYAQGIAHVPGYISWIRKYEERRICQSQEAASELGTYPVKWLSTLDGKRRSRPLTAKDVSGYGFMVDTREKLPPPLLRDVLYALVLDAGVLNYGCFEDWAQEYGYDIDSRKAETAYRACTTIAMELQSILGRDNIAKLEQLFQDY